MRIHGFLSLLTAKFFSTRITWVLPRYEFIKKFQPRHYHISQQLQTKARVHAAMRLVLAKDRPILAHCLNDRF